MKINSEFYDICVIGSGAGAGPIIYELSRAGYSVVVLEKGPWFRTEDFTKDEITATRRSVYTPNLKDEYHVFEDPDENGEWVRRSGYDIGRDFWNGNCVGGSSNFMSGYFHRMKPNDFRLLSEYGEIEGANISDWPIDYNELERYYDKVEKIVGVSGRVVDYKFLEPRSTPDFPYPPLAENVISKWIDNVAKELKVDVIPVPRAILSQPKDSRNACVYSNYCGSYGCASDAKGSSRVALIHDALDTGNCTIIPNAQVFRLETDKDQKISKAWYHYPDGNDHEINAKIFVVAAQAIETCRLLLNSKNSDFPNGLSNNNGQVGKNLIFSAGGTGSGIFYLDEMDKEIAGALQVKGLFVNRSLLEYYEIRNEDSDNTVKGGTVDFLFEHANAITRAIGQKWTDYGMLKYGRVLKNDLKYYFTNIIKLKFEVFVDWLPNDNCFVTVSDEHRDKWGDPVAVLRIQNHKHDIEVGEFLAAKAEKILSELGAKDIQSNITGSPPQNLQAGGCRFGSDPESSVLNPDCRSHEIENLYIADGSFMPTGGSTTFTWTIYANSFRVAQKIIEALEK